MSQLEFAEFLDDNLHLFSQPDGATLLELITTLEGKKDVTFRKGIRLDNGQVRIMYDETISLKGGASSGTREDSMELPALFRMHVPMFENDTTPVQLEAALKYRIEDENILFRYQLRQLELVVQDVFANLSKALKGFTEVQPLLVVPSGNIGRGNDLTNAI
jgi:uncharacterized protein YfdQ (DUF2303 family)